MFMSQCEVSLLKIMKYLIAVLFHFECTTLNFWRVVCFLKDVEKYLKSIHSLAFYACIFKFWPKFARSGESSRLSTVLQSSSKIIREFKLEMMIGSLL